jgi:hypothetical protein
MPCPPFWGFLRCVPPHLFDTSIPCRELEEEVQLLPQHVTLEARGRPLLVASPR